MQNDDMLKTLKKLTQYEIDATFILAQGLSCLSDKPMRDKISEFRDQCEDNIKVLSKILLEHGSGVPEHTRDFKGFFMQGYTGMRGLISDEGAIKALFTNTKMLVAAFYDALEFDMPTAIKGKVQSMLNEAESQLGYFQKQAQI